ncbi:SDR family NAD(P)-dependent oxidoreductase [Parasphingorhabdus halotolerans]|uniref:SDR family NAD(P)-dependent oxidoreductase n=1 Tax=Parasphingorhabdus halotolerans TaxID=2725558 RepID=A0A6H2DNU0_9SPHN|nr:SDR family NAD(P)-dependent oxidoreductase [Parasphingorhabdus halotolerans]QJB69326.1 SDR family NAD(P)-dependent oxidoreductase [Parasphingorhabdus halotolerans]
MEKTVLVMGAGDAIGSAIMRAFAGVGYTVVGARRNGEKLQPVVDEIVRTGGKAHGFSCDARNEEQVTELFAKIENDIGPLDSVVFNVGANVPMTMLDTDTRKFTKIWEMATLAGFLTGQAAARLMSERGQGSIIFTGATASMRGAAGFGAFASAKGALRNMVQSLAREMGPQNVHVAHVVIDAAVDTEWIKGMLPDYEARKANDGVVNPDDLAQNYVWLHEQPRNSWTFELDIRPWNEKW